MLILGIICAVGWILGSILSYKFGSSSGGSGDIFVGLGCFFGAIAMIINTLLWLAIFFGVGFFIK